MAEPGLDIPGSIREAATQYGVDPDFALRVAHTESQMNPAARSPKGAIGVMQLMPDTARGLGVDPHDTHQNILGGVRYLRQLQDRFGNDQDLIAAAYNAGPEAVAKHGGVPPYPETQDYVKKVSAGTAPPSADDLEKYFTTKPLAVAPPEPVEVSELPPAGAPPSADELEKHFGSAAKAAKPLTKQQIAAQADAEKVQGVMSALGAVLFHGEPTIKGVPNKAGPDLASPFAQGVTQGFGDEALGLAAAGATGVRNATLHALGRPAPYSMEDARAAQTQAARKSLADISAKHPVLSTSAEIAGSALPWLAGGEALGAGKAAIEAPSALGKVAQYAGRIGAGVGKGAALGATGGAITGAGNAEGGLDERAQGAVQGAEGGAILGGALGGAIPAAAPLAGKVVNALGGELGAAAGAVKQGVTNALDRVQGKPVETTAAEFFAAKSPTVQGIKSAVAPADVAEGVVPTERETQMARERVSQMMAAKGMKPDQLATFAEDIPHTTAEAIGSQTVNHAASLARRAGTTPDAAEALISQRSQGFGQAVLDDFAASAGIHPQAAAGDIQSLVRAGREKAAPLYEQAYASGPIDSPQLQVLANRPSMQRAMARAMRIASEEGREPNDLGFRVVQKAGTPEQIHSKRIAEFDLGEGRTMRREVVETKDGPVPLESVHVQVERPSAQTYDYVKRGLDDILESYRDKVTGKLRLDEEGRAIRDTLGAFRSELTTANPAYGRALSASGDYLSAQDAFHSAGRDIFSSALTARQFAEKYGRLSESAQEAYKAGVANKLYEQAQTAAGLRPSVLKSPAFQEKVRTILGDRADDFLQRVTQRARLQATGGRISPSGQSQTAPLLNAGSEMAPADALGNAVKGFVQIKTNPLGWIAGQAAKAATGAENIAETPGYRNEYGRILLQHPTLTAEELRQSPQIDPKKLAPVRARGSALAGYIAGHRRADQ
jgi:hypothetical protein